MAYVQCCPWNVPGSLEFPIPFPIDLDGPFGPQAFPSFTDPSSTLPGGPLGLSANLQSLPHRNWKQCGWVANGLATVHSVTAGYITHPGSTDGSETTYDSIDVSVSAAWDQNPPVPPKPQPEFFRPEVTRTMIDWLSQGSDGYYQFDAIGYHDAVFPVFSPGGGGVNQNGWYIEAKFKIYGRFSPYLMQRNGVFYLEHEVRVEIVSRCVPSHGVEPFENWFQVEGGAFTTYDNPMSTRNTDVARQACGSVSVRDQTGIDPVANWGSLVLFVGPGGPGTINPSATVNLRVRSNFFAPTF